MQKMYLFYEMKLQFWFIRMKSVLCVNIVKEYYVLSNFQKNIGKRFLKLLFIQKFNFSDI